jgi:hypothetical protein
MSDQKPSIRLPSEEWAPHYATLWDIACSPRFLELAYRWEKGFRQARHEFLRLTWKLKQRPGRNEDGSLKGPLRDDALEALVHDLRRRAESNPVFSDPRAREYHDEWVKMFVRLRVWRNF